MLNSECHSPALSSDAAQHHPRQIEKQLDYKLDRNLILDSIEEDQLSKVDTESYIIREDQPSTRELDKHQLRVSRIPTERSYSECSEMVQFNRCKPKPYEKFQDHNHDYEDGEENGQVPELLDFCSI